MRFPHVKPPLGIPIDPSHPLAKGLVGYWPMLENGGVITQDASLNGNTGTIVGATWVAGKFGPCLSFDGSDVVTTGVTFNNPQFTYSFWAKSNVATGGPYYALFEGAARTRNIGIKEATYKWQVWENKLIGDNAIVAGTWYHVVYTHNGTTGKLYIDAIEEDSKEYSLLSGGAFGIGAYNPASPAYNFNGLIDDVMLYNRALSAREIADLYTNPFGMSQPTFSVWWYSGIGGEPPVTSIPIFMYHYLNH